MIIDYIQPYSVSLDIGAEYNRAISACKDWICITDHDTLKPPGFAERLHKTLSENAHPNRVFTCMVNRVGHNHDAVVEEMFMEDSISEHLKTASSTWRQYGTKTVPTSVAPGYCMVFHKSLWEKLPQGFKPRSFVFDRELSRVGQPMLMKGVYIIHLYRWKNPNPEKSYSHLLRGNSV